MLPLTSTRREARTRMADASKPSSLRSGARSRGVVVLDGDRLGRGLRGEDDALTAVLDDVVLHHARRDWRVDRDSGAAEAQDAVADHEDPFEGSIGESRDSAMPRPSRSRRVDPSRKSRGTPSRGDSSVLLSPMYEHRHVCSAATNPACPRTQCSAPASRKRRRKEQWDARDLNVVAAVTLARKRRAARPPVSARFPDTRSRSQR